MDYDRDKADEMVLALLWLAQAGDNRAWKSQDWDAMNRLYEKGYISNPRSKTKSVVFTEEGQQRARELFEQHFGRHEGHNVSRLRDPGAAPNYAKRTR